MFYEICYITLIKRFNCITWTHITLFSLTVLLKDISEPCWFVVLKDTIRQLFTIESLPSKMSGCINLNTLFVQTVSKDTLFSCFLRL